MDQPYLTVDEAADLLRTSAKSVRNMIERGQVPAYRPTGLRRVLLRRIDLIRLVEGAVASQKEILR